MKALLFGAGASYGTLGSMAPIANDFGAALKAFPDWPHSFGQLPHVVNHIEKRKTYEPGGANTTPKLSLEEIWTCIDYYEKLRGALPRTDWNNPHGRGSAVPDLKRALLRIYGKNCDDAARKLPDSDDYTVVKLIKSVEPGDALISFNYDTMVERLAEKFNISLRMYCDELRRDVVNFAKPHGSTTWMMNWQDRSVTWKLADGGVILEPLSEREIADKKEPVLLGTVPMKSELIEEVQNHYGFPKIFHVVMKQWRALIEAVKRADLLIVVGYSFPREDQYGRFLFGEAKRSNSLKVEFYEIPDKAAERADCILSALKRLNIQQLVWKGSVNRLSASGAKP